MPHHPAKPLFTKVVMSVFTVILISASVLGNGFVLAIIARFNSLHTVPNILVANLAVVDLFNAAINLTLQMIYNVLEASWYRGRTLAIMNSILNRLFTMLNLTSMLAMMVDVYMAISFEIKYHVRKTRKKSLVCVSLIWLFSVVAVMLSSIPLLDIDLGDAHVNAYRGAIFEQFKYFAASFVAFFIICDIVVYFLTTRAIKKKKNERAELNLPPIQAEARLKDDIKAINTITITVAAYFLCYVPSILYAVSLHLKRIKPSYLLSAKTPMPQRIQTVSQEPLRSSDFKVKLNGGGNNEVRHHEVDRVERREACAIERYQNQKGQKYSGQRRNAVVILSIRNLQADFPLHHEVGDDSGYELKKAEKGGEARASNLQVQNLYDGKEEKREKGNDEVAKKCGLEKEYRKQSPSSSRTKAHPLAVSDMGKTGEPEEKKREDNADYSGRDIESQETSEKKRNAGRTSGQKFGNVVWKARINKGYEEEGEEEQEQEREHEQKHERMSMSRRRRRSRCRSRCRWADAEADAEAEAEGGAREGERAEPEAEAGEDAEAEA
ncbi:hypothetical protein ACROYT_G020220 [Oculina patagonica]